MPSPPASERKRFPWTFRSFVDRLVGYFEKGTNKTYPETAKALGALRAAVAAEFPCRRLRSRHNDSQQPPPKRRRMPDFGDAVSRKHYYRARRLTTKVQELEAKLAIHTTARGYGDCISQSGSSKYS